MSSLTNASMSADHLRANPFFLSMMAFSIAIALCLDVADAFTARDALHAFPVQRR